MAQTKMKKVLKVLALLLTGVGMIAMLVVGAMFLTENQRAETENHSVVLADTSDTCGDNLAWTLSNGVLTISGTEDMTDYGYTAPWYPSVKEVVIEDVVTITWQNWDGTTLDEEQVTFAGLPIYNSAPPTRTATAKYSHEWDGWTLPVELATEDATYTANFEKEAMNIGIVVGPVVGGVALAAGAVVLVVLLKRKKKLA